MESNSKGKHALLYQYQKLQWCSTNIQNLVYTLPLSHTQDTGSNLIFETYLSDTSQCFGFILPVITISKIGFTTSLSDWINDLDKAI